jgi:1-acyl-sn-glycerol-3-phosphate acyltransferase
MKASEITVENYENVYEHFGNLDLNQKAVQRWYALMNWALRPRVQYAAGARADLDQIHDQDYHHIYAFNHRGDWDACEYFSILHQVAPYDVGSVHSLANSFVFEASHLRPFGKMLKDLGLVPVFLKSYYSQDRPHRNHPERLEFLPQATEGLFDLCTSIQTDRRKKLLICPEGMYNKGRTDTILPIQRGIAEIAHRVAAIDGPVAITIIGFAYGKKPRRFVKPFGINAYVGRSIFVDSDMSKDEITKQISDGLLSSVKRAVELY